MNKKGFTLAELLGVIVVLAIIISISGISVVSIINKSRLKVSKEMEDNLKEAAITYVIDNKKEIEFIENIYKIKVKELIIKNYFEDDKNHCERDAEITVESVSNGSVQDYKATVDANICAH